MFTDGLRAILDPHFEVVSCVCNGMEVVAAGEKFHPDLIVMDISMPLLNGIGAAEKLRKLARPPKVVFLSMHSESAFAMEAFRAGAVGYVLKSSPASEILSAIQQALRGGTYISPQIAGHVVGGLLDACNHPEKQQADLTPRQKQILQLIAEGKAPKEIAGILNISPRTVEFHKYRIMETAGVRTIADLTRYAMSRGLI
jgi:DNA-binding NarL/FixJ family response regulator